MAKEYRYSIGQKISLEAHRLGNRFETLEINVYPLDNVPNNPQETIDEFLKYRNLALTALAKELALKADKEETQLAALEQ